MDSRKRAVSIRMSASDVRKVKLLADRLGVRDSDVIRFAVKSMMNRLGPLHDPLVRGRNLVPVFLDNGHELFHSFDLDAVRLECIINEGAEAQSRVSHDDIQLIAANGARPPYLRWNVDGPQGGAASRIGGNGSLAHREGNGSHDHAKLGDSAAEVDRDQSAFSARSYLFQKYLYGGGASG